MSEPVAERRDRISRFRQIRLAINVPTRPGAGAGWIVTALTVSGGLSTARGLYEGEISGLSTWPNDEECAYALDAVVRQILI